MKEEYWDGSNRTTRLFLDGGAYEVADPGTNETIARYYSLAGQRVMRADAGDTNEELYYLLSDHLGSTAAVLDDSGALVANSQQRSLPFGGELLSANSPTDFGYTGQRNNSEIGWMDYNARWYSPTIARFTQPDSIVPIL